MLKGVAVDLERATARPHRGSPRALADLPFCDGQRGSRKRYRARARWGWDGWRSSVVQRSGELSLLLVWSPSTHQYRHERACGCLKRTTNFEFRPSRFVSISSSSKNKHLPGWCKMILLSATSTILRMFISKTPLLYCLSIAGAQRPLSAKYIQQSVIWDKTFERRFLTSCVADSILIMWLVNVPLLQSILDTNAYYKRSTIGCASAAWFIDWIAVSP